MARYCTVRNEPQTVVNWGRVPDAANGPVRGSNCEYYRPITSEIYGYSHCY